MKKYSHDFDVISIQFNSIESNYEFKLLFRNATCALNLISTCSVCLGGIKNGQTQRNWQHRIRKTKKNKTKTQHNMCWTPLCANKHKERE